LLQLEKDMEAIDQFIKELDTLNKVCLRVLNREYDKTKMDEKGILSTLLLDVKDLGIDKHNTNWIDNGVFRCV
jgi:hypothetical protein